MSPWHNGTMTQWQHGSMAACGDRARRAEQVNIVCVILVLIREEALLVRDCHQWITAS